MTSSLADPSSPNSTSRHSTDTLSLDSTRCVDGPAASDHGGAPSQCSSETEATTQADKDSSCNTPSSDSLSCYSNEKEVTGSHLTCTDSKCIDSEKASEDRTENVEAKEVSEAGSLEPEADSAPDGGLRAWLVVVGIFCLAFTAFGCVSTWGVFQAYYEETFLKGSSSSKVAWIGSVQNAMVFIPSMIVGRIFDLGYYHTILISSSILLVLSTILVAECKVYWHFLLCQGFVVGLACGGLTTPSPIIVSQWFKERRALVLGITSCGGTIGGTLLPIAIRGLIPRIGFQWTMRVLGLIFFTSLTIAILTVRRRIPASKNPSPHARRLGLKPFKSPAFVMWCLATLFIYLGMYTCELLLFSRLAALNNSNPSTIDLAFVASTAVSKGLSQNFSFILVAIYNGSQIIGRVSAGIIGNYIGPLNHMIPATTVTAAVVFAWPAATTRASLVIVSVLYGFSAGSFGSLLWHPIFDLGEQEELSQRVGIMMLFIALAAQVGPPMSGAVMSTAGMTVMGVFAGECLALFVRLAATLTVC
ncbi:MFS general substrate transporter [Marasmius fiardii PR-910]|nr:MFS general substrate transporter [Marasmius fiardii PR-910]